MTRTLPPAFPTSVSTRRSSASARWSVTSTSCHRRRPRPVPRPVPGRRRADSRRVRRRLPGDHRAGPRHRPHRQRVRHPALPDLDREEQRLRRGQPRLPGSVVIDIGERMNRILEVNEKLGYALLEPGVTYFDLYEYLQATHRPDARLPRPRLGLRRRQRPRPRRRLHPVRRPLHVADGHGGGAAGGRRDAHRHGRGAGQHPWQLSPTGSARTRTACSPSPISASSPRWASR